MFEVQLKLRCGSLAKIDHLQVLRGFEIKKEVIGKHDRASDENTAKAGQQEKVLEVLTAQIGCWGNQAYHFTPR